MAESDSTNPGQGLDTGTGGFQTSGVDGPTKGKSLTLDVGAAEGASLQPWSPGQVSVDKSVKDITNVTKNTLAAYLSKTTLGLTPSAGGTRPNVYPVVHGDIEPTQPLPLRDSLGYTQPLTNSNANLTQPHFADVTAGDGRSSKAVGLDVHRGLEKPVTSTSQDGNKLLPDAVDPPVAAQNPPPPGEVNVGSLRDGPVKSYTEAVVGTTLGDDLFDGPSNLRVPSTPVPDDLAGKAYHLSQATRGELPTSPTTVDNAYPIDNPLGQQPTTATLTTDGYPSPLSVFSPPQQKFSEISTGRSNDSKDLNILRGREKPQPTGDPKSDKTQGGNELLRDAAPRGPGQDPPPKGTVNTVGLSTKSPVKYYTEDLVKKNKNTSESTYVLPQNSLVLRPAEQLETTPYNGVTPQDVPDKRKTTLKDYLGTMTQSGITSPNLKGNPYPVDTASVQPETLQKDGYAQNPHASPNSKKFIGDGTLSSKSSAATRLSNYGLSRAGDPKPFNGHELLKTATPELKDSATIINPSAINGALPEIKTQSKVNDVIQGYYGSDVSNSVIYNRFNPDGQFARSADGSSGDGFRSYEGVKENQLNGLKFARKYKKGASVPDDGLERDITYGRLAQVGHALSIRASSELSAFDDKNNPTGGSAQAAALLPGWTQIGTSRIEQFQLTAEDVLSTLPDEGIGEDVLIDPMALSWGSLNNVQDQYAGISAFGMQLLAIALLIGLAVVITLMSLLFLIPSSFTKEQAKDGLGRAPYGRFRIDAGEADYSSVTGIISAIFSGQFSFWRMLGVPATFNKPDDVLPLGALGFFGVSIPNDEFGFGGVVAAAGQAILDVSQNPGYYSIMSRAFTRSFVLIGDAFAGIGKAFGQGIVAGLTALFSIIEVLRNSKFMKSISIFVQLGDRIKFNSGEKTGFDKAAKGGATQRFLSDIDNQPNGEAVRRSRLKTTVNGADDVKMPIDSRTLAWSSYRSPDLLIMPNSIKLAIAGSSLDNSLSVPPMRPDIFANPVGKIDIGGIKHGGAYVSANVRIPTDVREKLEDALEAEYMPFYLHDVRTNEIVSFHAFLASLSDDYSAQYDSFDAFGRVEQVKIYKGTQRKVGLSFYIVATNPSDFNSMWLKINKLTTMVYPQFTEGRAMTSPDGNYKLEAPFSQTIQAAPLVRLRVGDVIRSNYSKFNLARLFGYGTPGTKFGATEFVTANEDQEKKLADAKAAEIKVGGIFLTSQPLSVPSPATGLPGTPVVNEPGSRLDLSLPPGLVIKLTSVSDAVCTGVVEVAKGEDLPPSIDTAELESDFGGPGGQSLYIIGKAYVFKKSDLIPAPSTVKKIKAAFGAGSTYVEEARDFMNDDANSDKGNAISRAFRSSGGKGLAGFIESLAFDWYDRTTWEIGTGIDSPNPQLGRRAPKMCKVTLSFSPIHDITPGLDVHGFNRAPIYPVGAFGINDLRPQGNK